MADYRVITNSTKRHMAAKTRFNSCWFGTEYPKATYNSGWQKQHNIYHPTIKNVEFLSWILQISSDPLELVFDGFIGSGSTAVAAIQTGRSYLGSELNPRYYHTALQRIKEVTDHEAVQSPRQDHAENDP